MNERVDVSEWTDDEWIAAMRHFLPDAPRDAVERWIAERRARPAERPRPEAQP